jgi:hypothetical protein
MKCGVDGLFKPSAQFVVGHRRLLKGGPVRREIVVRRAGEKQLFSES